MPCRRDSRTIPQSIQWPRSDSSEYSSLRQYIERSRGRDGTATLKMRYSRNLLQTIPCHLEGQSHLALLCWRRDSVVDSLISLNFAPVVIDAYVISKVLINSNCGQVNSVAESGRAHSRTMGALRYGKGLGQAASLKRELVGIGP